jgi:hypothetical protein
MGAIAKCKRARRSWSFLKEKQFSLKKYDRTFSFFCQEKANQFFLFERLVKKKFPSQIHKQVFFGLLKKQRFFACTNLLFH